MNWWAPNLSERLSQKQRNKHIRVGCTCGLPTVLHTSACALPTCTPSVNTPWIRETHTNLILVSYQLSNISSYWQYMLVTNSPLTSHGRISYRCFWSRPSASSLMISETQPMWTSRCSSRVMETWTILGGLPLWACDGPGRKGLQAGTEPCCGWDYKSCNHR